MDTFESPFYPGSKQRKDQPRPQNLAAELDPFEGIKPRVYTVKGTEMEFFLIGDLAAALGREAGTVRKWETTGVIPRATFQAPNPNKDQRARRRLYSRAQAEGIVRIAREEDLFPFGWKQVGQTRFTERVIELFRGLSNEGK